MSNPNPAQPAQNKHQADVSVTVRSEAAAVGEPSPLEQLAAAMPPKEAVASLDSAKEYASSALSSAATLPSTATLVDTLQQARDSKLLETAKATPLSATGQRAVHHAEALIDASQRLLEEKAPHDEAQTLLAEGAAAAAAVRDALAQHADVVGVFGSEQEREQAQHQVEDTMRRAFEVTQALVKQQDVRGMLADAANLAAQWVSAVSLASVHHAVAGVSDKGERVLKDAAPALAAVHVDVDASKAKELVDTDRAAKAADDEMQQAAAAREQLALKLAQLAEQARTLAMQLKDHPQLRAVVSDLLHLFRAVTQRAWANLATMTSPTVPAVGSDAAATKLDVEPTVAMTLDAPEVREHAEAASEAARKLIANFGGDLAPVQKVLRRFVDAARGEQPQVTNFLDAADEWLRDADTVADEAKAKQVYALAQQLLAEVQAKAEGVSEAVAEEMQQQEQVTPKASSKGELRAAIGELFTESRAFIASLKRDETATAVQTHLQELTNALFVDEQTGLATVKPELLDDLRRLVPALVQALATLPVARIDVSSDEADVILDNISLAAEVLPKDLRIDTSTQVMLDTGKAVTTIKLFLRNVQVHIPDLVFWYNKKSFPQLVDVGIADVTIPRLDVDLTTQPSLEPNKLLKVLACEAKVHDLVLDIKKARHNWMYTLLSPWVRRQLSSRIEAAVQESLKSGIETIDRAAERAAEAAQYAPQTLANLREALPALPALTSATQQQSEKEQQQSGGLLEAVGKRISGVVEALTPASTNVEKEQ